MHKKLFIALGCLLLLQACRKEDKKQEMGYAPIYGNTTDLYSITLIAPQSIENGGKIYVYGDSLYQVESGKGIHITDISNPAAPEKKSFLKVNGAQEVAIKDGLIYTNNFNDLVVVQLSGSNVNVLKKIPAFQNMNIKTVPPERGWFECPDKTKGTIIGWQKKMLTNPKCHY